MRSASEFRQMARETLRGNWKLAMGTGLAASLIGAEIADTALSYRRRRQECVFTAV